MTHADFSSSPPAINGGGFDPGYDDLPPMDDMPISFGNGEESDMDETEMGSQMSKRIKPEYVNFAKKAKRVDVRKLKETIWKELAIPVAEESDSESDVSSSSSRAKVLIADPVARISHSLVHQHQRARYVRSTTS